MTSRETSFAKKPSATWSLDQLKGTVANGQFVAATDAVAQAGLVKATVGGVTGTASVRVFPPLPWSENFDAMAVNTLPPTWVNTTLKFVVREFEWQQGAGQDDRRLFAAESRARLLRTV